MTAVVAEKTLPSADELASIQQDELNVNREVCQAYIKENCKRGDSVVIYKKGSKNEDKNATGEIISIGVQTIEVFDRINGRQLSNVCYHSDIRLKGVDFAKNHHSFDHSEETKMIRRMSKGGANSSLNVMETVGTEIKRLEDKIEDMQSKADLQHAEHHAMILGVIEKVEAKTAKPAKAATKK
tara:strand:- start:1037 stop:1585 length:549 start_codon:yes stop_codon:yes gene_type:complete